MSVKISLNGDGLNYEGQIELLQATKIMAFIVQPEIIEASAPDVIDAPLGIETNNAGSSTRQFESPRVAIKQLNAQTNPQKIVAIALYLGATPENGNLTTIENVLIEFKKAGEPTPKNISRDLRVAVSDGYVYKEEKDAFRLLTPVDLVLEQNCFPKQKRNKTRAKRQNTEADLSKGKQKTGE
jgi:hypothetical protein